MLGEMGALHLRPGVLAVLLAVMLEGQVEAAVVVASVEVLPVLQLSEAAVQAEASVVEGQAQVVAVQVVIQEMAELETVDLQQMVAVALDCSVKAQAVLLLGLGAVVAQTEVGAAGSTGVGAVIQRML